MKFITLAFSSAMSLCAALGITAQTFAQNTQPTSASQTNPKAQAKILDQYGKLPLNFEANQGQTDSKVKFLSRGQGYSLFLTSKEAVIALKKVAARSPEVKGVPSRELVEKPKEVATEGIVIRMELAGANARPLVMSAEELSGKASYFIGNDPSKWRTNVPTYAKVKYEGVYPGVDLVYYGKNQGQLEYDFVVAPGADPNRIQLKFRGAGRLRVDEKGDLLLGVTGGEVRFQKPVLYQQIGGEKKPVEGSYVMVTANRISFRVPDYDLSKPLVIDPVFSYSTFLGGGDYDSGRSIAVDASGAYVTGETGSTNFPTANALQSILRGTGNVFVSKLNPSGSALVYSTYLGGSSVDGGSGISVDASGNAYVTGYTSSVDFPTVNALQSAFGGGNYDAFVTKINATGSALVYSTYLGGNSDDLGYHVCTDASGDAYVTGVTYSTNFPTANALQAAFGGGNDAFVTKINATGSALVYSTYLGGDNGDVGYGIAADASGNAYVTGPTYSTNFPTANALQANLSGSTDAFVTKLNASGSALVYSTFLGRSDQTDGRSIAVDASGNAYVTGYTGSVDFATVNAFQTTLSGSADAFVTKLNASGSALVYSTYLGGSSLDEGLGIAVDASGEAYVTGESYSTNFPTANALQPTLVGLRNAFVTKLNASGSALVYSTYLGGSVVETAYAITVDSSGNAYVTGFTASPDFPTLNPLQPIYGDGGNPDAFVAKIASVGPRYSVCLLYDPTEAKHSGATIPIKLQLCDGSGNDLSSSSITVHAISVTQISTSASGAVENAGNSNPGNDFRFDATLGSTGGYIFNLKTTGLSTGTYKVNFTVTGDSFVYAANFEVK